MSYGECSTADSEPAAWNGRCAAAVIHGAVYLFEGIGPGMHDVRAAEGKSTHAQDLEGIYRAQGDQMWRAVLAFTGDPDIASDAVPRPSRRPCDEEESSMPPSDGSGEPPFASQRATSRSVVVERRSRRRAPTTCARRPASL